jgi:hypothetical protein
VDISYIVPQTKHRIRGASQWAFFPDLRLLLTSTLDFSEQLADMLEADTEKGHDTLGRVHHVVAVVHPRMLHDAVDDLSVFLADQIALFQDFRDRPYLSCTVVSPAIALSCSYDGEHRRDWEKLEMAVRLPGSRDFMIDWHINGAGSDNRRSTRAMLTRRTRKLQQKYAVLQSQVIEAKRTALRIEKALFAEIGLSVPRHPSTPEQKQSPEDAAWAAYVDTMKYEYVERRVEQLLIDPSYRPPEFQEARTKMARGKQGKIDRGMVDAQGKPQRPLSDAELDRGACYAVARMEATDLMFDIGWERIVLLCEDGVGFGEPLTRIIARAA